MTLLMLLIVFSTWKIRLITASCPDNEEPVFCWSSTNVPQKYCTGVNLQHKWWCRKSSYGRCACKSTLFRRNDGKCVSEEQCDDTSGQGGPKRHKRPPEQQGDSYEIPEELRGSPLEVYRTVLEFVQQNETLYAVMMTNDDLPRTFKNAGKCLKSEYITKTSSGALRLLECFKEVPRKTAPSSVANGTSVRPDQYGEVEFDVLRDKYQVTIALSLNQRDNSAAEDGEYGEYDLRERFFVFDVTNTCLLLNYGSWGKRE
ncbi:uncharacterized protein LOC125945692 [Dermacentor silvarum]|uniref:uncharacterized protein LOC125945692 n=1 Tax=Dermacentor silvarum TaxID=543639 RepID=UPI002100818C|nr:uncharacterized protein LOC125945692 [Dermacentor silvarum]